MKKENYYTRVIKRKKNIKKDPIFINWATGKRLNHKQFIMASNAIYSGMSSF